MGESERIVKTSIMKIWDNGTHFITIRSILRCVYHYAAPMASIKHNLEQKQHGEKFSKFSDTFAWNIGHCSEQQQITKQQTKVHRVNIERVQLHSSLFSRFPVCQFHIKKFTSRMHLRIKNGYYDDVDDINTIVKDRRLLNIGVSLW